MCIVYTTVVHIINDRTIKKKKIATKSTGIFLEKCFVNTPNVEFYITCTVLALDIHGTRMYLYCKEVIVLRTLRRIQPSSTTKF